MFSSIREHADKYRYGVVRQFVGHGVGRVFHADPVVLHFSNNSELYAAPVSNIHSLFEQVMQIIY